jgi:hypothetical protein
MREIKILQADLLNQYEASWTDVEYQNWLKNHQRPKSRVAPSNWTPVRCATEAWEIAKVFMLPGCKDCDTPEQTDISGMLDVMINAKVFGEKYDQGAATIVSCCPDDVALDDDDKILVIADEERS